MIESTKQELIWCIAQLNVSLLAVKETEKGYIFDHMALISLPVLNRTLHLLKDIKGDVQ